MSQKAKSLLVIIGFVAVILAPVCYGFIREMLMSKGKTEQVTKP